MKVVRQKIMRFYYHYIKSHLTSPSRAIAVHISEAVLPDQEDHPECPADFDGMLFLSVSCAVHTLLEPSSNYSFLAPRFRRIYFSGVPES